MFQSFPSPSSWLEEDDDPVVAKVNRRMQQITGLTVKTAELLQVGAFVLGLFLMHVAHFWQAKEKSSVP